MKLLTFSCHNIGPFFDRSVSVNFLDGRYMIKAPIGSGKSFLFFDGPVFGIYKFSDRQMLSTKATAGYIKICFEHEGKILVCIRDIARTKFGNDTVKSSIFVIEDDMAHVQQLINQQEVITRDIDSVGYILQNTRIQRIECKNETDVQATLSSFIPPQEVFLSTSMLLQNSENVFELAPADRISLFKEIFGLLSIDSATDTINNERKIVSALLKSKKVTDDSDQKLQAYLGSIMDLTAKIATSKDGFSGLLHDLNLIKDNITITGFTLDDQWDIQIEKSFQLLNDQHTSIQHQIGALQGQEKQLQTLQAELLSVQSDTQRTQTNLQQLEKKLQETKTLDITSEKKLHQESLDRWLQSLPAERFTSVGKLPDFVDTSEITLTSEGTQTFQSIWDTYQVYFQQGALLVQQEKAIQTTIEQLKNRNTEDAQVLQTYTQQLDQLQKDYDSKKKFFCIKIGEDCPFVEQINTGLFVGLQKNIQTAETNYSAYKQKILSTNISGQINQEEKNLHDIQQQLKTIKSSIYIQDFKKIKEAKNQFDLFLSQQQQFALKEKQHADEIREQENMKKSLIQLQEQLKNNEKQQLSIEAKITGAKKEVSKEQTTALTEKSTLLQQDIDILQKLKQQTNRVQDLITQQKDLQRAIKSLEEKEQLLNDLYRIFSKELMIKVLEDALPFFADYVNNLLAKLVPFNIRFQPKKTSSEKLELDITVHDHHGERSVKSLSGGQKAILRLAWILGVAQMTNVKQLFLDETINNIDQDTIGQVADMLQDYVKFNNISLYLVTHSSQLQQMDIWDKTIYVG